MSLPAPRNFARAIAIVVAVIFVYSATLWKLVYDWSTDPNYSHGLLIPFVIAFILWNERDSLRAAAQGPRLLLGGALVALALLGVWAGTAGAELFMQRISFVLVLIGIAVYFWGPGIVRPLVVPLILLLLAIPIPTIIFNKIAFPLQLFASQCAVWTIRLFDIPVLRQGNVIELLPRNASEPTRLEVVEACSGIRSLMTLLTLAVVFAYFTHPNGGNEGRPGRFSWLTDFGVWRAVLVVAAAVPIAILTNALRVGGTGILAHYYGIEVAEGFFHTFSGWVVYILALHLLFSVGLDRFFGGSKRGPKGGSGTGEKVDPVGNGILNQST
jgi:exosortase